MGDLLCLWFGFTDLESHDCYAFMEILRQSSTNMYIVC